VTVRDPSGKKAVLGIGFEERSEAFDFGVALQEARRVLGWESGQRKQQQQQQQPEKEAKDYSLKEGETITVNLGKTGIGRRKAQDKGEESSTGGGDLQSFALAPPPGGGGGGFSLPPPPSADDVKRKRRSAQQLGFDDGQFGEFA